LVEQLKLGGRLVIPVGQPGELQNLMVYEKDVAGKVHSRNIAPVVFVPLTRDKAR
jgi:protein-L-isoaspartate(D-aspartate) O-methyltransferase